jgi:uncharacterized protein YndB with AHSA1/START domain
MARPTDETLDAAPAVTEDLPAPPERVFDLLLDPTTYPSWLVGAQRIRAVDPDWPRPGAAFHHVVGFGPVRIRDRTTVIAATPSRRLELCAHAGPLGTARVRFDLTPIEDGTRLQLRELPATGPLRVLWHAGGRSLVRLLVWGRNRASLTELGSLLAPA